jgi:hypothetical protein
MEQSATQKAGSDDRRTLYIFVWRNFSTQPPPSTMTAVARKGTSYLDVLVLECFYIEANRWYSLDSLVAFVLKSIQNCRLAGIVKTKDQNANLLAAKEAIKQPAHQYSHCDVF